MTTNKKNPALREIRTLFGLGRVGNLADGELLARFTVRGMRRPRRPSRS